MAITLDNLFDRLLDWEIVVLVAVVAVVLFLIVIGSYVTTRTRTNSSDQPHDTSGMLTNFRELHSQGQLSDDEYREIKTKLAGRLRAETGPAETGRAETGRAELNDSEETG